MCQLTKRAKNPKCEFEWEGQNLMAEMSGHIIAF